MVVDHLTNQSRSVMRCPMRVLFSVKSCAISVATPIRAAVIITTISITIVGSKKSSSGPILRGMVIYF